MKTSALLPALLLVTALVSSTFAAEFFVAKDGRDDAPGTREKPFASLECARNAVRVLKKSRGLPPGGVTVWIGSGTYFLEKPLELTADDSGTEASPIVYRAQANAEVRLTGGKTLKNWRLVEDPAMLERLDPVSRGKVWQTDLKKQGITNFGEMKSRGFGRPIIPAGLELFFQDKPCQIARYPNEGWLKITKTPDGQQGGKFCFDDPRPKRWKKSDQIWVHGYWTQDWADSYERVAAFDAEKQEVATVPPHGVYGYTVHGAKKGTRQGGRFYFLNVLEEIDKPGEWFLDRQSGLLYFWPPTPIEQGTAVVSLTEKLITLDKVSHVTLQGFTLECCRGTAVSIEGGTKDVVADCTLRNLGNLAVSIHGGTESGVSGCEIHETGDGGMSLVGGDRKTLAPAGLFAENNHLHHYSRWSRTYRPAIGLQGVGNRISHNLIHDAPHCGILFGGNDHLLEYNEIHDVCLETGDVGAIYAGRDWTARGTIIRYNFLHHLPSSLSYGTMGVYLDDAYCGTTLFGNVFYKASHAAFLGGGRDNTVENNLFIDCDPAVHLDARALGWMKASALPGGELYQRLSAVPYNRPPYSTKYPHLADILDDEPATPKGNLIARNVCFGGQWLDLAAPAKPHTTVEDNWIEGDPGFVDAAKMNFQLRDDSPVYRKIPGFKKIPFEEMGIKKRGGK